MGSRARLVWCDLYMVRIIFQDDANNVGLLGLDTNKISRGTKMA